MKNLTVIALLLLFATTLSAQLWAWRYFDSPEDSYSARSIIELPNGNGYALAGKYEPDILSLGEPLVMTLFQDGLTNDFHFPFSSPSRENEIRQIIAAQGGGFLLAGDSQNFLDGEPSDHYVAKLNADFELVWKAEFAGIDLDRGSGVMELADSSIIAFGAYGKGYVTSTSGGVTAITVLYNGHVAKVSANGAIVWEYVIEDYDQCIFYQGVLLDDDKILVAGEIYDVDEMKTTQIIVLLNENGEKIWLKELATEEFGRALTPFLGTDGTIYLASQKRTAFFPDPYDENLILCEITPTGEIATRQEIDLGLQANIAVARLGNNGNVFLGGSEFIDSIFLTDPFFVEVDLDGNILQKKVMHTENYREFVNDLIVSQNGEILLLGVAREDFPGTENHAFLTKFSTSVPTREIFAAGLLAVQVYPVPASDNIHFSFGEKPLSEPVEIAISDAFGRIIHRSTVLEEDHILNRKGLPAGAYYYQIRSGQKLIASGQLYFQ